MKRFAPIAIGLLLFVSGWGQTLAAAFCPHAQGGHACCHANRTSHRHEHASHHEATPTSNTTAVGEIASLDQPAEECDHCMSHPRLPAVPITGAAGQSKLSTGLNAPPQATVALVTPVPIFTTAVISRQHAPPGVSSSRHVLIGLFRI